MAPPIDDDDDRTSDSDFNPDEDAPVDAGADAAESSSDDNDEDKEEAPARGRGRRKGAAPSKKRKPKADAALELDSGDEATIQERKKKRRKGNKDGEVLSSDEEGEAGWVKTRSQRLTEQTVSRRPLASTASATIDVESVWARLSTIPLSRPAIEEADSKPDASIDNEADYITIKRTTRFAGQLDTEEKRVHKHSAEAKIWLQEQADKEAKRNKKGGDEEDKEEEKKKKNEDVGAAEEGENQDPETGEKKVQLRRPLKRPSRFEPNPTGEVKGLPPHLQLRWPRHAPALASAAGKAAGPAVGRLGAVQATKLNTVEKSRHDWAGYVDKAGIAGELDEYGKSKASYLSRTEFLSRTEGRKEDDRREARLKILNKP